MPRFTPDEILDLMLNEFMLANEEVVCSLQPTTFFHACWPALWVASTPYLVGALVRPPTGNGFIYECTIAGTSAAVEPAWGVAQDATFVSGTATFKTHANYSLVNQALIPADMSKGNGAVDGRTLTIVQKMGALVHTSGTVGHTALIDTVNNKLKYVTVSVTSTAPANDIVSGRTTLLHELKINVRDPSAV